MIPNQGTSQQEREEEEEEAWGHHAEVPEHDNDTSTPTDGNTASSSLELRQMANAHFANSDFDSALACYTAALEAFETEKEEHDNTHDNTIDNGNEYYNVDTKVIFLCNRATCLYRMEMFEESRVDALEAVKISNGKCCKK